MVLISFLVTADLDVPKGQNTTFYALAMKEHIEKTSLDELDCTVVVF